MHQTLHIIPLYELQLFVSARSIDTTLDGYRYFKSYGFSETEFKAYIAETPQLLTDGPFTREEFASARVELAIY